MTVFLSDLTLQSIGFRALAMLIIFGVHGFVVAATAVLLGDAGPKQDGRLTVMPTAHTDLVGAAALILFGLGWPKPMAIDAGELRIGRIGAVVVILAGFLGLLAVAATLDLLLLPALTMLSDSAALATAAFLRIAGSLSIWVALFSLVPIPPLAAGLLLPAMGIKVPRQAEWILAGLLLAAVATGIAHQVLGPAHAILAGFVFGE